MDGIEILNGVVETESEEEFMAKVGAQFDASCWGKSLNEIRRALPRDVAAVEVLEEPDRFTPSNIYFTYCRRGFMYVYKAF